MSNIAIIILILLQTLAIHSKSQLVVNISVNLGLFHGEILRLSDTAGHQLHLNISERPDPRTSLIVNIINHTKKNSLLQLCGCIDCRNIDISLILTFLPGKLNIQCNKKGSMSVNYGNDITGTTIQSSSNISMEFRNSAYNIMKIKTNCWYELPINNLRVMFQVTDEDFQIKWMSFSSCQINSTSSTNQQRSSRIRSTNVPLTTNRNSPIPRAPVSDTNEGHSSRRPNALRNDSTISSESNNKPSTASIKRYSTTNSPMSFAEVTSFEIGTSTNIKQNTTDFRVSLECHIWKAVAAAALVILAIICVLHFKKQIATFLRNLMKKQQITEIAIHESINNADRHSVYSTLSGCVQNLVSADNSHHDDLYLIPHRSSAEQRPSLPPRDKVGAFTRMEKNSVYSSIYGCAISAKFTDISVSDASSEKIPSLPLRDKARTFNRIANSNGELKTISNEIINMEMKSISVFDSFTKSLDSNGEITNSSQ